MKYVSSITTALLLTFAVCFAFACPANAQAAEKAAVPILSVDGSGTASGAPDQAIVSIGVTNYAANALAQGRPDATQRLVDLVLGLDGAA